MDCPYGHRFSKTRYGTICPHCGFDLDTPEKVYVSLRKECGLSLKEERPVCAWLVCIEGARRGKSYVISFGENFIGTDRDNEIQILGDEKMLGKFALVFFDKEAREANLIPARADGIVYMNNKPLYDKYVLKNKDILEIGESKFMYVELLSAIIKYFPEFKYEDDKRLLGYVLIHELYKDVNGNEKSSNVSPIIDNVMKKDTVDDVKAIKNENSSVVENTENNNITHLNNSKENQLEFIEIDNTGDLIENSDYENLTGKIGNDKSEMTLSEKINNPSEYSVDLFEKNWEKIRKEIRNAGAILNALMADTYPEEIKNGVLVIRFPDGHKFHSRQIMELDKKSKIEAIINKICNTDIKITTIFDNDARENSDDEFIEKVINFFDGEIIEKK